jgi:hypothetical protein
MNGVFDRLQKKLKLEDREDGITPIDLMKLPPNLKKVMRFLIREYEMTYPEITSTVESFPERDQMSKKELDQALEELCSQGWLIKRGLAEKITYQVNLRHKPGSDLAKSFWGSLDQKIKEIQSQSPPDEKIDESD